jgi:Tfp pilus assembly protein PilX
MARRALRRTLPARQRGVALLAVSLLLVVVGALAFMMNRQAAMAANTVNSQYDAERARYLAEAGLNVAEWRDQQVSCKKSDTLVPPTRIDSRGTFSSSINNGEKTLDINATGGTDAGASVALSRKKVVAHTNVTTTDTLASDKGHDTFITDGVPTSQNALNYLELTQGSSNVLIEIDTPGEWDKAVIVKAELTMTLYQSNSTQPGQSVSVHRVTRGWNDKAATWLSPTGAASQWTKPGGDYAAGNVTATTINGNGNYVWDITALVDGWVNNRYPNNGLLMRADGPSQQARFYGFKSATGKPVLSVTYYKAC